MTTEATTWKLTLAYDGGPFRGWQVQPGEPTVQGTLAAVIERVTGEAVLPQGSGRTDAGVHALGQVASFSLAARIPAANLLRALNRALPPAVRILSAEPVPAGFHARHSAVGKTYEYRIFERRIRVPSRGGIARVAENATQERICSPFLAPFAWDCRWPLELAPMQQAAALLVGTHDFTSFAATDPDLTQRSEAVSAPNPVKTICASTVVREGGLLRYRVTGSGFLHHMVRNIVGTLVEVGRGSLGPAEIPRILAARDRAAAGPTAPAHGLYLVAVEYPAGVTARPSAGESVAERPVPETAGRAQ
jgi:tRNA pseudouridine38-40 synthase